MSGWNTIESDAGVFTELVERLDVKNIQFEELYSFDQETLASLAPLYGVIFLFKYNQSNYNQSDLSFDDNENVFFAKQTIQNACATQAVLNVLLNRDDIDLGSELTNFKEFVSSFDSDLKGETISNSDLIRSVHNSFSSPNLFIDESQPREQNEDDDELYHFIGYVRSQGSLYELDGLKKAPINHGSCQTDDEFITKLPEILTKRISQFKSSELRFSLLGIIQDRRKTLVDIDDKIGLEKELSKRELWKFENELRRKDFIGLIYQVLKTVSKDKNDDEWNELINKSRTKGVSRILSKQLRR